LGLGNDKYFQPLAARDLQLARTAKYLLMALQWIENGQIILGNHSIILIEPP